MNKRLLECIPERYLCPYCGKWHIWDGKEALKFYNSWHVAKHMCSNTTAKHNFPNIPENKKRYNDGLYRIYFEDDYCYYSTGKICVRVNQEMSGEVPITEIIESEDKPIATFNVEFTADDYVGENLCDRYDGCIFFEECIYPKLGDEGNGHKMNITFGFEFKQSDWDKFSTSGRLNWKEKKLQEREKAIISKEQDLKEKEKKLKEQEVMVANNNLQVEENKEDITMKEKVTGIWEQLYEHSPKENVEIAKKWAEKYKPTLKWAVPVVSIYAAWRILKSKDSNINIDNVDKISKKTLGFQFDNLKDKELLKELVAFGGITAGAYAVIKGISAVYNKNVAKELSVDQIEECMDKLDGERKKFGFIQPKTEQLLPVALSVIIVYVMTQNPTQLESMKEKVKDLTGNFGTKVKVYAEMFKLFLADKLHVDLNNEEESKKVKRFAFLAAILGIGVLLYGKKILGDKAELSEEEKKEAENSGLKVFAQQVISIMEKIMPTAFAGLTTWLVAKKVLKSNKDEIIDVDFEENSKEESDVQADVECGNSEEQKEE